MTERIDFTKSEQYTLSIRLSADGFSFSIYNPLTDNDFCFVPPPVITIFFDLAIRYFLFSLLKSTLYDPYRNVKQHEQ